MAEENAESTETTEVIEADNKDADALAAMVETPATETIEETEATDTGWNYAEGIKGEGDAPEWFKKDKYATIEEQAKAYPELAKMFGSFTGAPEEYAVNLSEEIKEQGYEIAEDDPLLIDAMAFAKESKMGQEGFDKMLELHVMNQLATQEADIQYIEDEKKSLGDRGEARVNNLLSWGNANLSPELYEGFKEMTVSANAVKALEHIITKGQHAPLSGDETSAIPGGMTEAEIKAMQFEEDDHGNRKLQTDPEFKKRFQAASKAFYGSHDHNEIVGS